MVSISLCMIVRNEEKTLARCLDTIHDIVDEIIIVDTGSIDATKEIAARYTDLIYDFEWVDNFAIARNFSFSKATKEYCMWMDADDVLELEDQKKLKLLKENMDGSIDTILMRYNMTSKEDGALTYTFYRERLVKRSRGFEWHNPVHEYLLFEGTSKQVDIAITHKKIDLPTDRNLRIFEKYIADGNELMPRDCFYYARELYNVKEYKKAIDYFNRFLVTKDGLLSSYLDSCIDMAKCYHMLGDDEMELKSLLRFFEIQKPRAEICCKIGYYFKDRKDLDKAIGWFSLAPYTDKPTTSIGAILPQCWDYVPYMELCSCWFQKGNIDLALQYNQKAVDAKPNDRKAVANRAFLASKKKELVEKMNKEAK
ncbi:MAG: glycosyltransferase family 2 protein, partial [Lachnospiraceae bacterium]|nr:glycosyltransferase family 2 protein [Lachnospiraceae bacterium]